MRAYEPVEVRELVHRGPRRGVAAVRDVVILLERGRGVTDMGVYSRRSVRGGRSWSLHAVGRAWDAGVPIQSAGDYLASRFVQRSLELGVCEVIFGTRRWTPNQGWRYYGKGNHETHVHVGFTKAFADSPADPEVARFLIAHAWAGK